MSLRKEKIQGELFIRVALALALWGIPVAASAGGTLKTVVIAKESSSPFADVIYQRLGDPQVGDYDPSKLFFFATAKPTTPPKVTKKCLFALDSSGTGRTLSCRGDTAPFSGQQFRIFSKIGVNAIGESTWGSLLSGDQNGIFHQHFDASIPLSTIALVGSTVPHVTGALYFVSDLTSSKSPPFPSAVSDDGLIAFRGKINLPPPPPANPIDDGVFICDGGSGDCSGFPNLIQAVVLKNDGVPDRPGYHFCNFSPTVDASTYGLVFRASIKLNCADTTEKSKIGIFRKSRPAPPTTIALEREAANPSPVPGGALYDEFNPVHLAINNSGDVMFHASTATNGVVTSEFLFFCPGTSTCQPAPGTAAINAVSFGGTDADSNRFTSLQTPGMDEAGDISFTASVKVTATNQGGSAVYVKHAPHEIPPGLGGPIERIVLTKDPVPDQPGARFKNIYGSAISPGGRVAFRSSIENATPPRSQRSGLFLFE